MDYSRVRKRTNRRNNKVPTGWLDYSPMNTWIENTRLVPFKCPLKWSILRNIDERERFSLDDLVERLQTQGRQLGLIVDLTDTDRYYDYRDVEEMGIEYYKIRVPGHQDVPEKCCRIFFDVVSSFLRENAHNDKLIGIHCTHGINRSGYFVVRYLVEMLGLQPDDAMAAFDRARGHQIEKYIDDLRKRVPFKLSDVSFRSPLSSWSSSSRTEERYDQHYSDRRDRDRPLPYSRSTTDSSSNEFSSRTPKMIV